MASWNVGFRRGVFRAVGYKITDALSSGTRVPPRVLGGPRLRTSGLCPGGHLRAPFRGREAQPALMQPALCVRYPY